MWALLERLLGATATAFFREVVAGLVQWWRERQQRRDQIDLGRHQQAADARTEADDAKRREQGVSPSSEHDVVERLRDPGQQF